MKIEPVAIGGVMRIEHDSGSDVRGSFFKVFRWDREPFAQFEVAFAECYYSFSRRGVLRGLHFQVPPHDHLKLVTCVAGEVFDCIVDLRTSSPTYADAYHCQLSPGQSVLIPPGCAHGFVAVSDVDALLVYHVTTVHAPEHDAGIHWTSVDVPWPIRAPIVSERDQRLPLLAEYRSPF
jgi:dTDP-4-dehydrorhamnose 3,5-epimerase